MRNPSPSAVHAMVPGITAEVGRAGSTQAVIAPDNAWYVRKEVTAPGFGALVAVRTALSGRQVSC
jgi:hypothetical protein